MQTAIVFLLFSFFFLFWRVSYIIYPLFVDLGPPFVDHAGRYLSACPICHLPQPSVSCSNQDSTIQGSFSHECDQIVRCGHLMWRWQLLLELLLHHAPMAGPLYWSFFLEMPWEAIFKGMSPFLLMILVSWGQDYSRRCLLVVWTFFIHPQAFLPPWHGS